MRISDLSSDVCSSDLGFWLEPSWHTTTNKHVDDIPLAVKPRILDGCYRIPWRQNDPTSNWRLERTTIRCPEQERFEWPHFQANCLCPNGLLKSIARLSTHRASRHHPSTRLPRTRRHARNPAFSKIQRTERLRVGQEWD